MRTSYLVIVGVFLVAVLLVNVFFDNPVFQDPYKKIHFELESGQPEKAEKTYVSLIIRDSLNVDLHYNMIHAHFAIPQEKKVGKNEYIYRSDDSITNYYLALSVHPDQRMYDIGNYGSGLIQVESDNPRSAINYYNKVQNQSLKYLNNSRGYAYMTLDSNTLAEECFNREIAVKGNISGAYQNLASLYSRNSEYLKLRDLINNPDTRQYIPFHFIRLVSIQNFSPFLYCRTLIKGVFNNLNFWGLIGALFIAFIWFYYMYSLDVFEKEKFKWLNLTFILGMFFCFGTFLLSDLLLLITGFTLNGNPVNDFFYCVFGIGAVEELVKILPLLLILRYTKQINEAYDYILYACIAALGFSFIENLEYFGKSNLEIIHGRAMLSVVSHMFDTSVIAYGLVLNKYRYHRNPYLVFGLFFLLASLSHGFYDFWLINESAKQFSVVTVLFFLATISLWRGMYTNALNHSSFYDKQKHINNARLFDYLLYALTAVLLLEYLAMASSFGPSVSNKALLGSIFGGTYLIFFLSGNLSKVNLLQGKWQELKLWDSKEKAGLDDVLGEKISLKLVTRNELTQVYLPNEVLVLKRITISKEVDWYLVKLEKPCDSNQYDNQHMVIRTKYHDVVLAPHEELYVAVYLFETVTIFDKSTINRQDIRFLGWAFVD